VFNIAWFLTTLGLSLGVMSFMGIMVGSVVDSKKWTFIMGVLLFISAIVLSIGVGFGGFNGLR
jgi:hypothetical protein